MSKKLVPLVSFLDFAAIPHYRSGDEEQLRRARLLVAVSLFMGISILAFAIVNLAFGRPVPRTSIAIPASAGMVFLMIPILLRATGRLSALSGVLTFGTVVTVVASAWNAYGLYSPGLLTLPIPVLIGLVLGGRRLGGTAAVMGLAAVIGFYALDRQTDRFASPSVHAANAFLLLSVLVLGILLIAGIGWFYESLRRYAVETARQALEEAEAANAAKREFLASMSHELRTPLNSVIGFSQVVMKKEELSSSGRDMLERVHSSGIHLLHLVDQILDVTKVEAGEIELDFEAVDVAGLVRDTMRDLEGQKPREHVELVPELPPGCALLVTDREKLRQVLVNLLVNAFKFTRQGSVTVRLVCPGEGAEPGDEGPIALEVQDTGIGIPGEKLDKIFGRFVQVDTGTSRKFDGTGLGLSICKDLCDLLGYTLDVESEPDRGTKFRVGFS